MYKMIIADDEASICIGLRKAIDWERMGIKIVASAENGTAALEYYKRFRPHIVIADINMPGLDGLTLLSRIKQIDTSAIVIFISAHSKFSYAQQAIQLGAFNYLIKPFSEEDLITVVKKAISNIKENESTSQIIKFASITQERYSRDIILSTALGILPLKESAKEMLSHIINMNLLSCLCFGVLHKAETPEFIPVIHSLALKSGKENNTDDRRILIQKTAENEVFIIYFFKENAKQHAKTHSSDFIAKLTEYIPESLRTGISNIYPAETGFQKLYIECCAALIALPEKESAGTVFRFKNIDSSDSLPDISMDEFSGLIIEAYSNNSRKQIETVFFRLFIQQCDSGRIYNIAEYNITMMSYIEYLLQRLDLQLTDNNEIKKIKEVNKQIQTNLRTSILDCYMFFSEILKTLNDIFQNNISISNHIINVALSYIKGNYNHAITLSELSKQLLITPNYLSKLFKEKTGYSFTDYITMHRIETAKKMLKTGKYKIYEIAERTGYSDSQYFSKQFKKSVGLTPTEYTNSVIR